MRIAALLEQATIRRFAQILPESFELVPAGGASSLSAVLARTTVDVVVIDPLADDARRQNEPVSTAVRSALLSAPAVPLIIYVSLDAQSVRSVLPYATLGASDLLIRGLDDHRTGLVRALGGVTSKAMARSVQRILAERLVGLPHTLRGCVIEVFDSPTLYTSVDHLATRAGVTRRSVDRWLSRAGVTSARLLLCAARVLAAYRLLRVHGAQVTHVARTLGYTSARGLSNDTEAILARSPRALARDPDAQEVLDHVFRRLFQRPETSLSHAAIAPGMPNDQWSMADVPDAQPEAI
jgi:AraC-like DNA-binding protein